MLIYIFILMIVTFSVYRVDKLSCDRTASRFFHVLALLTMILGAGLRDRIVGTDTPNYVHFFDDVRTFSDFMEKGRESWEYGFWMLTWLVHLISGQYLFFLITIALFVVGCYQWAIVAYSVNIGISSFVFIAMGFYTFFFNGARQGIACAICALAIGPMLERNFSRYLGYILLACLFHKTAIIMLPVYLVFKKTNTLKSNIIYGLIGIAGSLSLQKVVAFGTQIDQRYADYANADTGGGYLMVTFSLILTIFFLLFKKRVLIYRDQYNLFLNMLIFGTVISLVSVLARINPSGILRLAMYFNVSVIFLWPIVFNNLTNRSTKFLLTYVFVVGYIIFFVLTTERFGDLVPYTFNPYLPFI